MHWASVKFFLSDQSFPKQPLRFTPEGFASLTELVYLPTIKEKRNFSENFPMVKNQLRPAMPVLPAAGIFCLFGAFRNITD